MITNDLAKKFIAIVGKENYDDSQVERASYSYDSTPVKQAMPDAVIAPRNTQEVSEIVKICNEYKIPIYARGTGTNLSGGCTPVQGGIVMIFKNMNKIKDLDLENLTITVEPGVITMDIIKTVEAKGLFYPPDPGTVKISTIVGNIAENAGGLRGLKYGVTRDYVIGLEIVLANGDIIKTGGKLAKDVAGYDLTRLIVGSEGTLGIVTEAILKLIPKPETKKTALALFQDVDHAARTVSKIIAAKIIPTTLEFMDKATIEVVEAATKIGLPTDVEAVLLIEQDGPAEVVARDMDKIAAICKSEQATSIQVAKTDAEGDQLATARRTALSALARLKPTTILEDATVPRSEVANLVKAINDAGKKYNVKIATFGHAGDGNLHPTCPTDARDHDEMHRVEAAFAEIFQAAVDLGGTISGEHGIGTEKAPYLELKVGKAGIAAMKAIKDALDPNNILNPGKIFLENNQNRVVITR
jgi:glycolate oxidase